jgi:putative oxidoreductase
MYLDRGGNYWPETLSITRIVVGLLFLEHGTAKPLGFPTPPTPAPAMMTLLWTQGVIELVGGLLIAIGLFTRPVAFFLGVIWRWPTSWVMRPRISAQRR